MINKYRKKPVTIEAILYTGKNKKEITDFTESRAFSFGKDNAMEIPTLEGNYKCSVNDYVIKGIKGEFYSCKPDIFRETYEEVKDEQRTI